MKTLFFSIFIALISLISAQIQPIQAQEFPVADSSAMLTSKQTSASKGNEIIKQRAQREAMIRVLSRYNSPLVDHVDSFIEASEKYELEDYFLVSIAGVESTFAQHMIQGTHNAYGYGRGTIVFNSWEHGIDTVGSKLRENYINRGAETIDQIGPRYAGGSITWAPKVKHFISEFKNEEQAILQVNQYLQG
jgi:hypothetical protein